MFADVSLWVLFPAVILVYLLLNNLGRVSKKQALEMIESGATLLDVRTPEEVQGNPVEGAINIPLQLIGPGITETLTDPSRPVLCFCLSGARSSSATARLKRLGFQAHNLGGVRRARSLVAAKNPD